MARIVVVGSVAHDEVIRLTEPIKIGGHLNGTATGGRLGGGGANTAVALAAAGHEVTLLATVGWDAIGDSLLADLDAAGIDTSSILRINQPSTRSLLLIDQFGERTVINTTVCEEESPPKQLLSLSADVVYICSRRRDLGPLLAAKANTSQTLIVAHLPPLGPGLRPAHVLIASFFDISPYDFQSPKNLGESVSDGLAKWIAITVGAAGAYIYGFGEMLVVPAKRVNTIDTTGAGDAFAAGLIHALSKGWQIEDALEVAVRFGTEATLWSTSSLPAAAVKRLLKEILF